MTSFGFVFSYSSRRIILKEGHVARSVYFILSGEGLYSILVPITKLQTFLTDCYYRFIRCGLLRFFHNFSLTNE